MSREILGDRQSQIFEFKPVNPIRVFRNFLFEKKTGKQKKVVYIPKTSSINTIHYYAGKNSHT